MTPAQSYTPHLSRLSKEPSENSYNSFFFSRYSFASMLTALSVSFVNAKSWIINLFRLDRVYSLRDIEGYSGIMGIYV